MINIGYIIQIFIIIVICYKRYFLLYLQEKSAKKLYYILNQGISEI